MTRPHPPSLHWLYIYHADLKFRANEWPFRSNAFLLFLRLNPCKKISSSWFSNIVVWNYVLLILLIHVILRFLHCMKYVQLRFLEAKWTVKERSYGNWVFFFLKNYNSTVENLTSHNRFACGWQSKKLSNWFTQYKVSKIIFFNVSVYWKFKKAENLRHRIIQFSIEVFKTTCQWINIRKCNTHKKKKWHYSLTF